jgi:RNA polymerase sigma-70 factor (ECF subfamily)
MEPSHHKHVESPTVTSTSLLHRIQSRDRDGWSRFVALYGAFIYDTSRRLGVNSADADDVVQEVLRSVSRSIETFQKTRPGDSFRGWLYRIIQNKARDHFRKVAKQPPGVGGSDFQLTLGQVPEELTADSDTGDNLPDQALFRALELIRSEFQERTWTAFWRLTVDRHSAAEIAADLDMNATSVRQAKFRVLQRLKAEFGELIELPE